MKYVLLLIALTRSLVDAFVVLPKTITSAIPTIASSTSTTTALLLSSDINEVPGVDAAWRHVKKPMLRIGAKGASESHGNSLRELLNAHTVVKVKINTTKLGTLEEVFDTIKALAEKSGKIEGIELVHIRKSDNIIMFGIDGAMNKIRAGEFPPPPPPPREEEEEKEIE
mmetsp:Transcript_2922/g.4418  ORF Transcript_2922/g.4418 Transcript_2922/m.4418 type:complete len:169 (+) Transcript_2922:23-529(+)